MPMSPGELALDIIKTWKSSPQLQAQFGSPGAYIMYREAQHNLAHVAPVSELPEVKAYVAKLEASGNPPGIDDLALIHSCAEQWRVSADIRNEFRSFAAFCALKRHDHKRASRGY